MRQPGAAQAGPFSRLGELVARISQQCEQQVLGARELVATLLGVDQGTLEGLIGARCQIDSSRLRGDRSTAQFSAQPRQEGRRLEAVQFLERGSDQAIGFA
jgi:hypothetical protein